MNSLKNKKICILGAGVVGLSVAYRLLELNEKLDITIIAKEFGKSTTSDGAGGLFRPDQRFMPGVSKDLAR
jgi:D-aspartate oxidase